MELLSGMGSVAVDALAIHGGAPVRPAPIDSNVVISAEARGRIDALIESGLLANYHNGPWAHHFEEAFAAYHGEGMLGIAVNSGTSALHLALCAAGVGPGDEVIVPALCFVAAATAIVQNGAIPVVCDAEADSLTLDLDMAETLIGPRTRAILPVHFWGYPSQAARLRVMCDRHGLILIEDCAQAFGARVDAGTVGTFGDFATYAFSVRKHIGCGEGGMVLCGDPKRHRVLRELSNYGKGPGWDDYSSPGFSYRMAEFPAIVALDGLTRLDDEIAARRQAAEHYMGLVAGTDLEVVPEPDWGRASFFKCPLRLPPDLADLRQAIVDAMSAENVSCRVPHRPLFAIPWLKDYLTARDRYRGPDACPVAAAHHARLFEIECGPNLPIEEARLSGAALDKVWRHLAGSRG